MLTGELKSQIDRIWDAFWSGGISNPLEVIEQITYLLFLRRLDDLHTLEENKAARLKKPMARRVCWTELRRCTPSAAMPSPNSTRSPTPFLSISSVTPAPTRKVDERCHWRIFLRRPHIRDDDSAGGREASLAVASCG
jgi:hypothetical protein